MRRLFAPLLLLLSLAPSMARADEPAPVSRYWVQALGGATYLSDRSFDFIASSDPVAVGDVRFGYVPGWMKDRLELDFGYVGGTLGGTSLGVFHADYEIHSLQLGLRYRLPVASFFSVYGRLAALLDFNGLHLTDADESFHMSQWALTGGLEANVGAELTLYAWKAAQLGLVLEFGYAQRFNEARFDKVALERVSKAAITPVAVDVGSLNVSGIQWRLGAVVHF